MTANAAPFIRPLRLVELLDQAIHLYRLNFIKFIGIIAIPYIPLTILQTGLSYLSSDAVVGASGNLTTAPYLSATYWLSLLGVLVAAILQFILVQGVAAAALTRAIADNYTGSTVGIVSAYRKMGSAWLRLVGAILLIFLLQIGVVIWMIIPCIGWFTGPGFFIFISLIVLPLVAPVIVLEKHGISTSLRRAWDLGRSRFWWLVGFVLILLLFNQLVVAGPVYLINLLMEVVLGRQGGLQQQLVIRSVIQLVVSLVAGLLYFPLQSTAMTMVYFDLRVRSEGLDLAMQAAGATGGATSLISVAETSPAPQGSLLTGRDIGYFALLSLIGIALYAILISLLLGLAMVIAPLSGL